MYRGWDYVKVVFLNLIDSMPLDVVKTEQNLVEIFRRSNIRLSLKKIVFPVGERKKKRNQIFHTRRPEKLWQGLGFSR